MSNRTIWVSKGEAEYVGGTITETSGKDITADPIVVALGGYSQPPDKTTATAPTVDEQGATTAQRTVKLLIDNTYPPTTSPVWIWAWITDNPEVEPVRLDGPITIA